MNARVTTAVRLHLNPLLSLPAKPKWYNRPMMRGGDIFELRLFDRVLAVFSFGEFEPVVLRELDEGERNLLPAGMEPTGNGLWHWLSTRAIPQNRRFATELCRTLGLSANDRSGIIAAGKGLSLNDSYWVVPAGFEGTFAEYNLFENGFSSVLAAVAYTGVASDWHGLTPSTPELTTNGSLRKAGRLMGKEQIAQLERLAHFEFANSERKPFPEAYLEKLSQFVRRRAETLAALPPVSRELLRDAASRGV